MTRPGYHQSAAAKAVIKRDGEFFLIEWHGQVVSSSGIKYHSLEHAARLAASCKPSSLEYQGIKQEMSQP